MKIKITKEEIHKLTRSKKKRETIHKLKRRAAGRHNASVKKTKKLAKQHAVIAVLLALVTMGTSSLAFAISSHLIPPPSANYPETEEVLKRYIAEYQPQMKTNPPDQVGVASWYALGLRQPDALTCASTKFPRGTRLKVKNIRNGKEVICLVNDYGPQPWTKKVIDLSRGSFVQIGNLSSGVAPVEIRVVR